MKSRVSLAVAVLAFAVRGEVSAQQSGASTPQLPKELPSFGTTGTSSLRLTALDFSPIGSTPYASGTGGIGRYPLQPAGLYAPVHIPGGTKITRIELDYCNTNPSGYIVLNLLECDNQGQTCVAQTDAIVSSGTDCNFVATNGLAIHVDNYTHQYALVAFFDALDGSEVLTGAIVSYQLEVSPAPGAATFNDVPTNHPFFQYIEALAASGITGGCGAGNYCPDAPLTRGQMAVFLAKALGLYWNNQ